MVTSRRLIADRFRRIWQLVEVIAAEPGHTRKELAERFHLSERQVQADLNIIRVDMRLPLVRQHSYRFATKGASVGANGLSLTDALTLVTITRRAKRDGALPIDQVDALLVKLPTLCPPHVQALVLEIGRSDVIATIAEAQINGLAVRLHYPSTAQPLAYTNDPVVEPEVTLPILDSWYLLGYCRHSGRARLFNLTAVTGAESFTAGAHTTTRRCAWRPCSREFTPNKVDQRYCAHACTAALASAAAREQAQRIPA